jgi:hypothetical protein
MFLIFDTYAGLCNQMYDIHTAINFCLINNIEFTFRYAALRSNKNLTQWYNTDFNNIFDDSFINTSLYKPFHTIHSNEYNTFNYDSDVRCIEWLNVDKAIYPQLEQINKQFIIMRQFWSVFTNFKDVEYFYNKILPSPKLISLYKQYIKLPDKYNLIHYRYERDFIEHFNIKNHRKLCDIIENYKFKDNTLPIYIATYEIAKIPPEYFTKNVTYYNNILLKNTQMNGHNFEELAFVDFMIGKNAQEIVGHSRSSFSVLLNSAHQTNNYYN